MREADLQKKAIQHAECHGALAIRLAMQPGVASGWPDVLFALPNGLCMFVEFKGSGGKATELQKFRIKQLKKAGHTAFICDDFHQFTAIFDEEITPYVD